MTERKPDMRGIVHGESGHRGRFNTQLGQGQRRTPAAVAKVPKKNPGPIQPVQKRVEPVSQPSVIIEDQELALVSRAYAKLTGDRLAKYLQSKLCENYCSWFSNYRNGLVMSGYFCQCGKLETIT